MTEMEVYGRSFQCSECLGTFPAAARGRLPSQCDQCVIAGGGRIRRTTQGVVTRQNPRKPVIASIQAQEQVTRVLEMRRDGHTWDVIARECGYADRGAAYHAAKREMATRQEQINETLDDIRQKELERLEHYTTEALAVLHREQPVFAADGSPALGPDGEPLTQRIDAMSLQALDRLVKVSESRRKLLGLDAATKSEVSSQVQFTVQGIAEGDMP